MQVIIDTISKALQENLETIVLMLIVVNSLYLVNIILGTVKGTFSEDSDFNLKKFLFGFLKALITSVSIFAFCYVLNLLALTLQLTKDVTISGEFITTIEVFGILVIWAFDLAKDIVEKIKALKTLKYVSYEDFQIQQNESNQEELG